MPAPVPDSPSISSSGYTDGLGRREISFDRETGTLLEQLHIRPEIGVFDTAITARVDRLQSLTDERFARPLAVERDGGRIIIVSEYVSGVRVSELLETPDALQDAPTLDLALAFLLEALPALGAFHAATGVAHGMISAGRTVLASSPQVVFLDSAFGDVIGRLHYSRIRLWREFGLAMPASAGPSRFTVASDIAQVALTALMIVLGRAIRDDEYPNGVPALINEVSDVAMIRGSEAFAVGLQQFLNTALSISSKLSYRSAEEAVGEVRQVAELEMGAEACRRALTAFIEQIDVGAQPLPAAVIESALAGAGLDDDLALDFAVDDTPASEARLDTSDTAIEQEISLDVDESPATYDLSLSSDTDTSLGTADVDTFATPAVDQAPIDSFAARTDEPAIPVSSSYRQDSYADYTPALDSEPRVDSTYDAPIATYDAPSSTPEPVATFEDRIAAFDQSEIGPSEPPAPIVSEGVAPEPVSTFDEREPAFEAFDGARERASEPPAPIVSDPIEAEAPLSASAEESQEADADPEPARSSFFSPRRKKEDKSKSARARKDRLRSAAAAFKETVMSRVTHQPEPRTAEAPRPAEVVARAAEPVRAPEPARAPEPPPPPVLPPPPPPKPAPSLIPAHRAAAFEPPVPEVPAAPRPFTSVTPMPPPPVQPAAVPPPVTLAPPSPPMPVFNSQPISIAPPAPPPAPAPIQLQGNSPISLSPSTASIPLSPSTPALKLKTTPVNLGTPPKRPRYDPPPRQEMAPFPSSRETSAPRPFPWKLAVAGLVLILGGAAAGRAYLMQDRKAEQQRAADEAAAIAERAKLPPAKRGPAAVPSGRVVIDTQPPGAKVLMDGLAAGQTPLTLDSVTAGRHVVTLISDSGSIKRTIKVDAGQTVTLNEQIFGGWVAIFAPITFDVAEKGRAIGNTEEGRLMLSPGRHELTLTNKALGYSGVHTVDIEPGEVRSLTLEPKGLANFNAAPWAEVWVNDQKIGETPIANKELPLGVHNVVFKNPQYGERKLTATVKANEPAALSVDFNR